MYTIVYARKSTESEDRQVASIEAQLDELRPVAQRGGYDIAEVLQESRSAKTPGRPVFGNMLRRINGGRVERVLCWKLDRLARNAKDGGELIWLMDQGKLKEVVTPSRVYRKQPDDLFFMQLEFGIAKKQVDDQGENIQRGLRARVKQGWHPSRPPIGYLTCRQPGSEVSTVVADPERFKLVQRMWQLLLYEGKLPKQIHRISRDAWGLMARPTRKFAGGPMTTSNVYKLFRNPFYSGFLFVNGELTPGIHEPMISWEEFEQAQALIGDPDKPRPSKHHLPYTALIRCAQCRCFVTAEKHTKKSGRTYVYYRCSRSGSRRGTAPPCSNRPVRLADLEQQLYGLFEGIWVPDEYYEKAVEYVRRLDGLDREAASEKVYALNRRLETVKKNLDDLFELHTQGHVTDDQFVERKNSLLQEQARLEGRVEEVWKSSGETIERVLETYKTLNKAKKLFRQATDHEKRVLLKTVWFELLLDDGKVLGRAKKPFSFIKQEDDFLRQWR